jgi:hypothetical protein
MFCVHPETICLFWDKTTTTVKPVSRGQFLDKEKWSFKTDDLLKEVQFI